MLCEIKANIPVHNYGNRIVCTAFFCLRMWTNVLEYVYFDIVEHELLTLFSFCGNTSNNNNNNLQFL